MADKHLGSGPTEPMVTEHGFDLTLEERDGLKIGIYASPHETDGVYFEAHERHESAYIHLSSKQARALGEYLLSVTKE